MINNIKYVLHPGFVEHNGTRVFVTPVELARLYNVPMSECVLFTNPRVGSVFSRNMTSKGTGVQDKKHLYPRDDGNYQLS